MRLEGLLRVQDIDLHRPRHPAERRVEERRCNRRVLGHERPEVRGGAPLTPALRAELTEQLSYVHDWGGRLVFPIPELSVVEVASGEARA